MGEAKLYVSQVYSLGMAHEWRPVGCDKPPAIKVGLRAIGFDTAASAPDSSMTTLRQAPYSCVLSLDRVTIHAFLAGRFR